MVSSRNWEYVSGYPAYLAGPAPADDYEAIASRTQEARSSMNASAHGQTEIP